MTARIIETLDDVAEGAAYLAGIEPRFARALELTGPLPLRRRADGFETLFSAIVSQQGSTASAAAIWNRLAAIGATDARRRARRRATRRCGPPGCRGRRSPTAGRSRRAGSTSRRSGVLPDAGMVAELTRIKGIGVWTAEIYAMFSTRPARRLRAGRPRAARLPRGRLFELEARPSEKALREMSLAWSPWRAVAARLLWAYYRAARGREGVR